LQLYPRYIQAVESHHTKAVLWAHPPWAPETLRALDQRF